MTTSFKYDIWSKSLNFVSLQTSSAKVDEMSQVKQIQYGADRYVLLIHFRRSHTIRDVFKREGLSLPIFSAVSRFQNFSPDLPNSKNLLIFFLSINVFRSSKLGCSQKSLEELLIVSIQLFLFFDFFSTYVLYTEVISEHIQIS